MRFLVSDGLCSYYQAASPVTIVFESAGVVAPQWNTSGTNRQTWQEVLADREHPLFFLAVLLGLGLAYGSIT